MNKKNFVALALCTAFSVGAALPSVTYAKDTFGIKAEITPRGKFACKVKFERRSDISRAVKLALSPIHKRGGHISEHRPGEHRPPYGGEHERERLERIEEMKKRHEEKREERNEDRREEYKKEREERQKERKEKHEEHQRERKERQKEHKEHRDEHREHRDEHREHRDEHRE